jgi:hypothetical protein
LDLSKETNGEEKENFFLKFSTMSF